jgi:hypothetical protein
MPSNRVIPPSPTEANLLTTVRLLRELVVKLYEGDRVRPDRAVMVSDLVKLGLITKAQAEELLAGN